MENPDDDRKQDQLEKHSLPGTNQAGKGPSLGENGARLNRPSQAPEQQDEQQREHSLPGTNQAGKSASAGDDQENGSKKQHQD
jgi:hypothetical protein